MNNVTHLRKTAVLPGHTGPGHVVSVEPGRVRVSVAGTEAGTPAELDARPVLGLPVTVREGDEILLTVGQDGMAYITGVLAVARKAQELAGEEEFSISAGARGKLRRTDGKAVLQVFSPRNELIFEYDPGAEKARVLVESGDLEIGTVDGDIRLSASGDIQLDGNAVDLRGRRQIALQVQDAIGHVSAWLNIDKRKIRSHSEALDIRSRVANLSMARAVYEGKQFSASVTRAKLTLGRLETVAGTLVQKAKNAYHSVEQLSQLKAGRMRTLVSGNCFLKSEKVKFKATDSFNIDGERINLG